MGSADYDLLLQEIVRDNKRVGLDQSGYTFTPTDDESPIVFAEQEVEE